MEERVIDREIDRAIKETSRVTAEEVVGLLKNKSMLKNGLSYTRRIEIVLYNYNNLLEAVKEKDEAINDLEEYGIPEKSKSITKFSVSGGNYSKGDRYLELIEKYKFEKKETLRDINRINKALNRIKEDKYYKIIQLKYLEQTYEEDGEKKKYTDEKIAELLNVERITIIRNKKRLINKITTILIPESIKDLM